MDIFLPEKRSKIMSAIRSKNTKPEMIVRCYLRAHGFGYRIHGKDLPGKPDIVLSKYKTVIFVHGCFWHQHDECSTAVIPKTRSEFWKEKLQQNKERDLRNAQLLSAMGWRIITIWECMLKGQTKRDVSLQELIACLSANS